MNEDNWITIVASVFGGVVLITGMIFVCHLLFSFVRFARPIPRDSMDRAIHKAQMPGDAADVIAGTEVRS